MPENELYGVYDLLHDQWLCSRMVYVDKGRKRMPAFEWHDEFPLNAASNFSNGDVYMFEADRAREHAFTYSNDVSPYFMKRRCILVPILISMNAVATVPDFTRSYPVKWEM